MDVSRVNRLLRLIALLRTRRAPSAGELAEEMGVSKRTVFRDLNMLELAGVPYYVDDRAGGYRIADSFFLPPVNLTLEEALALMTLTRRDAKLPLQRLAAQAATKIEAVLPRPLQGEISRAMRAIHVEWPAQARHQTVAVRFDELLSAIGRHRKVKIAYVSFFERGQIVTVLSPYRLLYFERAWYVIGRSELHGQIRTFKLGRIKELTPLDKLYLAEEAARFDLREHLGNAWGMIPEGKEYQVRLKFSAKVAANVAEVNWHPTQKVTFERDGSALFDATVDGLGEIAWWLLGYGDQVEVVEPDALRQRVLGMARAIVARYDGSAGGQGGD